MGANKEEFDPLPLDVPDEYNLQGAKLATLEQATAYRGIKEKCSLPPCPMTNRNLETIRLAIQQYQNTAKMDKMIWNSIRKCTI